jgi:hypothetical protein
VKLLRKIFAQWLRQKEALAAADAYHAENRARIATLVSTGRGREGLQENLSLLGIETTKAERPRLATLGGFRL